MKHLLLLLCLIPAWATAQSAYPVENMHPDVKPGDNFMQYAAGGWIESHPLKEDERYNGAFKTCEDSITARINNILRDLLISPQEPGSIGEYVSIMFKQFCDTAQRNDLGIIPLKKDLQAIRQASTTDELQAVMARLDRKGAHTSFFLWGVRPDHLHADQNIVGTGAYECRIAPDFFHKNNRKSKEIRKAYQRFGQKLFEFAGYSPAVAEARMKLTYDLEKKLTKSHYYSFLELFQKHDVQHSVHIMSRQELQKEYTEINWDKMFETSDGKMEVQTVDVSSPRALNIACKLLKESNLEELKCWAEFCLLWSYRPLLSQDLRRAHKEFVASQFGNVADPEQWKMNTDYISSILGMQIGQLYCERYVTPEHKKRIQVMTQNICEAFRHRIEQNPWMSDKTKQEALHKLDNIVCEVAYPDQWNSTEGLLISKDNSLYENYTRLYEYEWTQHVKRNLNRPVDRHEWGNQPQTVNAFCRPYTNSIFILAGILQSPIFDPDADEAINYGAIGTVIAHELTHGYDPIGCQFDSIGNVRNWWTSKDKHAYNRRTKVLRKYFGHLKLGKEKVNGYKTLRENVADNGGLNIALEAMRRAGIHDTIDGQTAEQRFFLGYARLWARVVKSQFLWYLIHQDSHAPSETRINGALPHIDAWYDAFGISPSDSLYLPKDKRAEIW